jgi:hypothetical protein
MTAETTRIDLTPYLKTYCDKACLAKIAYLPPVSLHDGPTWNDRVKRAESISDIVNRIFRRHQEEYEETFLDLRDKFLNDVRRVLSHSNFKIEGMSLTLTSPFDFKVDVVLESLMPAI